jgi:LmbE family N-acetylglucosaminyl deacetylase
MEVIVHDHNDSYDHNDHKHDTERLRSYVRDGRIPRQERDERRPL